MFAVVLTDNRLLETLRTTLLGEVINFWTPTLWNIRGLKAGSRVYFLLKSPVRKIAGHGEFKRYQNMLASEAWNAYGAGNGVASFDELVTLVDHFAGMNSKRYLPIPDPEIGCIELTNTVFYGDDAFIDPQAVGLSIPSKVVKIKYFVDPDPIKLTLALATAEKFSLVTGVSSHRLSSRKNRVRASAFRNEILSNYANRCCITGVALQELLEASHIQPYVNEKSNHPQNGLCLRVDLHCLFDAGLITLDRNVSVVLSEKLTNTPYTTFVGRQIKLPKDPSVWPAHCALEFHRSSIFRR